MYYCRTVTLLLSIGPIINPVEKPDMTITQRMAITLPAGNDVQASKNLVEWAERNGYQDAWVADGGAPDTLTLIGILASRSHALRFGTAVTPVYTRTPAVLAATANTLGQILPGRFVLGLGSSSHTMMEGWNGQKLERPLTRVMETAQLVRSMLAGEKSAHELQTVRSHGYRQAEMEKPPSIYLAALRPKMIEMAAQVGDGVVFNLWPKAALPRMMEHVRIGAKKGGKNWQDVEIVNRYMVCVTDDRIAAQNRFRAHFAPYYATPVYNKFLAWAGYEDTARAIAEGWAAKDRYKTTTALSDELVDDVAIIGSKEYCQSRIRAAAREGIHTHIIAAQLGTPEEIKATLEAFSAENFTP